MAGDLDIDGALFGGYLAMGLGLATAEENVKFDPPESADWAAVLIVPAGSGPISLGAAGIDEHTGFMQIDFHVPLRTGRAQLIAYGQAVRDEFIVGKGYTHNGQNVEITRVERSGIDTSEKWARLVMSVFFRAQTIRPEI